MALPPRHPFPLCFGSRRQEPGSQGWWDPTHLFLNIIMSKENRCVGNRELFCRCRRDKKILF